MAWTTDVPAPEWVDGQELAQTGGQVSQEIATSRVATSTTVATAEGVGVHLRLNGLAGPSNADTPTGLTGDNIGT